MEKVLIVLALALAGCTQTVGIPCEAIAPHVFEDATVDAMTDEEVEQEQSFNETVTKLCN